MGNRKHLALTAALCLALGACATRGTQTIHDFGRYEQTQAGITTKPQIHSIFGQPHDVRYITGASVWIYFEIHQRPNAMTFIPYVNLFGGGAVLQFTQVDFFFDDNGVLLRSERVQGRQSVNQYTGLANNLTPSGQAAAVEQEMTRLSLPYDRREARRMGAWADHLTY